MITLPTILLTRQNSAVAIRGAARSAAFTIVELLVVILIIVLLIAIILPSSRYIKEAARNAATSHTMSAMGMGLEAYNNQFNVYPDSAPKTSGTALSTGSQMVAQGLMGFLDYAEDGAGPSNSDPALGFRITTGGRGKIHGPFVSDDPKYYKAAHTAGFAFYDGWGKPILYYKSTRKTDPAIDNVFGTNANALFVKSDNLAGKDILDYSIGKAVAATLAGDPALATGKFWKKVGTTSNAVSGSIPSRDSYLLISAGKDGFYFNDDDVVSSR